MLRNIKNIATKLNSKFYFNYNIAQQLWFQTGGLVAIYCIVFDDKELEIILNNIDGMQYEIIGAGSNLLIRDGGFSGIILKLGKYFNNISINEDTLDVGASILDTNLSKFALMNSIKNFEFYSGIPGSIGGAIKMNAGCYGNETKNILKNVTIMNKKGKKITLTKKNINLSYRSSGLSEGDIITSACYDIHYGQKDEIERMMKDIKLNREKMQPQKIKTSGSTFKNPKNNYAAKLIEMAGCKGLSVGDACVSEKHANFLINTNKATANQIENLGKIIIDKVFEKFQIRLDWEIKILGNQ